MVREGWTPHRRCRPQAAPLVYTLLLGLAVLPAGTAAGEEDGAGSRVCISLHRPTTCPPGSAALGAERWTPDGLRLRGSPGGKFVARFPVCCFLPEEDILTENHQTTLERCPPGAVVTGADWETPAASEGGRAVYGFRCTMINLERYMLGDEQRGAYWGSGATTWHERHVLRRGQVPALLRHALGRAHEYWWSENGCVGYPPGALLVGRISKQCQGLLYRSLLYAGAPGDPPRGTPVPVIPECREAASRLEPATRCLDKPAAASGDRLR